MSTDRVEYEKRITDAVAQRFQQVDGDYSKMSPDDLQVMRYMLDGHDPRILEGNIGEQRKKISQAIDQL